MIAKLAWRNIWRNKVRSFVVVAAVTIGLFGVIFVAAISNGMVAKMVETSIENEISDMQVHLASYVISEDVREVFSKNLVQPVVDSQIEQIESYSYRIRSEAMASSANNVSQVIMLGVDPAMEERVSSISRSVIEGQYFGTDTKLKEIVVGQELLELLELKEGSKLVLSFADSSGNIKYESFRIVGVFKTNSSEFDKLNVHVDKSVTAPILGTGEDNYHELAVRCSEENLDSVAAVFSKSLEGFSVKKWNEINPTLEAMQGMMAISTFIMVMIVLIALIFGLINTMLMVVMERRKELGMLRALGLTNGKIARMIIYETVLLGLIGGVVGNLLSFLAIKIFGRRGIEFKSAAEGLEQFGVGDTLYPELQAYMYVAITALVLLTALLASIFPARRALHQDIAETIRN